MRYNLVCSGENPATDAGTTQEYALVAELADAPDSGSGRGNSVEVQVLSGAPKNPRLCGDFSVIFACRRVILLRSYIRFASDIALARSCGGEYTITLRHRRKI